MRKALFEFSESFEHDVHVYVEEWLEFPMRLTISECVSQLASAYDIPDVALEGTLMKLKEVYRNVVVKSRKLSRNFKRITISIEKFSKVIGIVV